MGYRRCHDAVAAACTRPSHGPAVGLPHGWRPIRDTDELRQGNRHARRQCLVTHGGRATSLQAACITGVHDLSDLAVHTHGPYLERCRCARLSLSSLPDRPLAAHARKSAGAVMTVSVNGIAVEVSRWPNPGVATVRELLRQRATAVGMLASDTKDDGLIGAAIERLLADEVRVPSPTEAECRRFYENHLKEFQSGDLVYARHILFQVTPSVSIPEIRARAERALAELLKEPDRFAALADELSNCPSARQGGSLGQIGRGDTVPEFERALFRLDAIGILPELVKTRHGFHIVAVDQSIPGKTLPFEAVQDRIAERLKTGVEERALRQYVSILAGQAKIVGVELAGAETPLVQ